MPVESSDTIGGRYQRNEAGEFDQRVFIVGGVTGAVSDKKRQATLTTGVPQYEDAHPDISGINVIDVDCQPIDRAASQFRVVCKYGVPTWRTSPTLVPQEITLDTTYVEEKTWFDINGVRLEAEFFNPVQGFIQHYPSATRAITRSTATISKLETTSETALFLRSTSYVGTVNDAPWFNWPARTWLFEDLQVRTSRVPGFRECVYTLVYNPETWRFLAEYIEGGRIPPTATEGDGFAYYDIRELTDFSLLPLTIPAMP